MRAKFLHRLQAQLVIGDFKTGCAGNGLLAERLHRKDGLDRAACRERVAEKTFHGSDGRQAIAEQIFQRPRFHRVVVRRGGAVRADKINFAGLKPAAFERALHRGESAPPVRMRRGGMKGVATRAPAGEPGQNRRAARAGEFLRLQHEHRRAFAQTDAGAPRIERTAAFGVEQQQRAKTVQRQSRKRIRSARQHQIGFALLDQFRGGQDCHRAGGTGGGDGGARAERAEFSRA